MEVNLSTLSDIANKWRQLLRPTMKAPS